MMDPRTFVAGFIGDHEGGLSMHPSDNGNWYDAARYRKNLPQKRNMGTLVGSKFGVTAYALVRYRLRKGWSLDKALVVTAATIKALDLPTAIDIGFELYFKEPGFDQLPWNRVTMSIFDKGWGSGPGRAIKMMQEMVGANNDGDIGPKTIAAYKAFVAKYGEEGAAHRWCDKRIAFDTYLGSNEGPNDPDAKFVNGWNNRSRSFLPGTAWWRKAGA